MTQLAGLAVFAPRTIVALNEAYDEACEILKQEGAGSKVRSRMQRHLRSVAQTGENDAHRICALAVQVSLGYPPSSLIVP